MKTNLVFILIIFFSTLINSCKNDNKKQNTTSKVKITNNLDKDEDLANNKRQYTIKIDTLDSLQFEIIKSKNIIQSSNISKIEDFQEAKKLLKGIVEFNDGDEDGESHALKRINFRNGKKYENKNEFDSEFFVAYFPTEDILLCEGGHSTDVSFDLKNGKLTEETGNPDMIIYSKNKEFRINGSYDGQECCGYFIQKKINGNFEKILNLEKEFKEKTKIDLCNIKEGFWINENTLYVEKFDFDFEKHKFKYFKIELIEK